MSEAVFYNHALWIVVAWPLLLAIPALHSRLPWLRYLAIIPTAILAVFPGNLMIELPHMLFGTGFAIDGDSRWVLLMSIVTWLTAATITKSSVHDTAHDHTTTFFLLTLTGNLGVILTIDMVGFFSFSTLMGYGFYGMLTQGGNDERRRASRRYLIFLIIADLALFEALLLIPSTTGHFQFEAVQHSMAGASSAQLYVWMVLFGFILKAGIWPSHLWLLAVFKSARQSTRLLLAAVPVAMAALGAVRWLPIGEQAFFIPGTVIQVVGIVGILYAVLRLFTRAPVKLIPAWVTLAAMGLFIAALGTGLAHPVTGRQYVHFIYPFITGMGLFLTALTFAVSRLQDKQPTTDIALQKEYPLSIGFERWVNLILHWTQLGLLSIQTRWHTFWQELLKLIQRVLNVKTSELFLSDWRNGIMIFTVLGLALAWLAK